MQLVKLISLNISLQWNFLTCDFAMIKYLISAASNHCQLQQLPSYYQKHFTEDEISQNGQIFCQIIFQRKNKQSHLEIKHTVHWIKFFFFCTSQGIKSAFQLQGKQIFAASNQLLRPVFIIDHTQV